MKVKKYQKPNGPISEPRDNTNIVLRLPPENLTLQEAFPGARKVTPGFENHPVIKQGYRVFLSKNNDHRVGQESVFGERKYVAPWNQSIAQRLWNHVTDAMQLTSPPTYQDGYGRTLDAETPFWEGAQGKQLKQMGKSALNAATMAGLSFLPGAFVSAPWATTGAFGLGLGADFLAGKAMDGIENGVLRRSGLKFSDNQKTAVRLLAGLYGGAKGYKLGTRLSTPDVPIAYEPKVHQNDFINAPGNAEGMILGKNADIANKQLLGQLSSKNPSKLTPEERAGMSRHDRTNVVKEKDAMIQKLHNIDYTYTPYIENTGIYTLRPALINRTMSRDDVLNTLIEQGKDQSIVNMYDFIHTLPESIDPKFMPIPSSKGMVQNPYVTRYRDAVLETVPASELLTDGEIARFLTFYDKQLSEGVTGALKGIPVWHASSADFNVFDYLSHLGKNMKNTGVYGPGNYFTTRLPINHYAGLKGHNIKPYYITNIKETIPASAVRNKKGYPIYVKPVDGTIPTHRSGDIVIVGENTTQNNSSFNMFLPEVMSNGELVGSKLNNYYDNNVFEITLPRNTGIKSLYPNMSRFVRNADGSVSFTPVDWNDPRVDFKNGGKL